VIKVAVMEDEMA